MKEQFIDYEEILEMILQKGLTELQMSFELLFEEGSNEKTLKNKLNWKIEFLGKYLETLNEAGYRGLYGKYQGEFGRILKSIKKTGIEPESSGFGAKHKDLLISLKKMNIEEMFGIDKEIASMILYLTTENIMLETPIKKLAEVLHKKFGDRLNLDAKIYIETATRQAVQKAEDITLDNLGIPPEERYWYYMGPLDNITRAECQWALEWNYFTNKERENFEDLHGIRYNCRHKFNYIPEELYNDKKQPSEPPKEETSKSVVREEQSLIGNDINDTIIEQNEGDYYKRDKILDDSSREDAKIKSIKTIITGLLKRKK